MLANCNFGTNGSPYFSYPGNRAHFSELYQKKLSYSAINTARAVLSAVIDPPEGCRFGNHPSVAYFHDKQLCVVHGGAKVQGRLPFTRKIRLERNACNGTGFS